MLLKSTRTREEGFGMLLSQYQERIYWQVRKMVEAHEDASDVTQEVWSKVVRYVDKFNEDSSLYTWLYRIAYNESVNFLKKQKVERGRREEGGRATVEASVDISEEETWEMLKKAISQLPEKQRVVFELRYFEEMPYRQMSDMLGTSVGALKASYHIAVKKIEAHVKTVCWA